MAKTVTRFLAGQGASPLLMLSLEESPSVPRYVRVTSDCLDFAPGTRRNLGDSTCSDDIILVFSWRILFSEREMESLFRELRARKNGACIGFIAVEQAGLAWASEESLARIRAESISVAELGSVADLRRVWIDRGKIGYWDSNWREVSERSGEYFSRYEMNIRCWVPGYENLIEVCASSIEAELLALLAKRAVPPRVLEIGFGTGALSAKLLGWIGQVNAPFAALGQPLPLGRVVGVDAAPQMLSRIQQASIGGPHAEAVFFHGKAFGYLPKEVVESAPFNVICGTLVLHDILGKEASEQFEQFLVAAKRLLTEDGILVFADCFADTEPEALSQQLRSWHDSMLLIGLSEEIVGNFLSCNPEMLCPVTRQYVSEVSARLGFEPPEFRMLGEEFRALSQGFFSVMILRRSRS